MTVAELIDKLRGMPQDLPVVAMQQEYGIYFDAVIREGWLKKIKDGNGDPVWTDLQRNEVGELALIIDVTE